MHEMKFDLRTQIQFENSMRLMHEFLKMLPQPKKVQFCLKFSKN